MRILLAGATGVVGRALLPRLVAGGHEVVGTTRRADRLGVIRSPGGEAVVLDVLDRESTMAVVAAVALSASLAACGGGDKDSAEKKPDSQPVSGGVKPVLKNVKVRPTEDDFGNKLKAWIADKGLRLFSDRVPDRNAVVTVIPIKGRLDDPDVQLWPSVLGVVRNAFVEGISSGFTHLPPPTADKPQGKFEQVKKALKKDEGPPEAQPVPTSTTPEESRSSVLNCPFFPSRICGCA